MSSRPTEAARRPRARPALRPAGPAADGAGVPWARRAGRITIAAGLLALLVVAGWHHPVGDYRGETDFYGGYVEGARAFQAGRLDPARYGVVGPLYDALLGLVAWAVRDFFVAGKLIAIASVAGTWILWRRLVASRLGDVAAFWATAFLVVNPVLLQSGYSVVSHGTGVFLQVASLALLLGASGASGLLLSGALAAAAALVRYPGLVLLPAAWLVLGLDERRAGASRVRSALIHLAGFLLVAGPWTAFSLSRGVVPAQGIFGRADFYLSAEAPNPQDDPGAFSGAAGAPSTSLTTLVRRNFVALAGRTAAGAATGRVRDARELLGLPVAALVLLGLAAALREGTWRRLAPLGAPWLLHAILLAPVYYNTQYALVLLPFYSALAGVAAASRAWVPAVRGVPIQRLLGAAALAAATWVAIDGSRFAHGQLPVEVREAGRALARVAGPGDRVIARKGHIGYYSGLPVVAFPRVESVAELGTYCRAHGVRWIYYSWYEALLRPELHFLLDTTAAVPGLELVHLTDGKPSRLFRVGPGFGADPPWWGDAGERRLHVARGAVQVLPERLAWGHHLVLAIDAANRRDPAGILEHADAAIRGRPQEARAWALRGTALHALGRALEARDSYQTALRLQPGLPLAERGLRQLR